jgi:phospholipid/cholesterol/gamma-HCH transport system substrate-binding protein
MSQNFRLGLFVLGTLAILVLGVFLVGHRESRFESNYRVRAEFKNVAGLNPGADVRIGGLRKGAVRRIDLPKRTDGNVTVVMDLAKETENLVKKDSVASIQSEGLLGDKFVEISFGSDSAEKLKGGETIESQPPFDISDLLNKSNQILDTTQGALQNIQGASENLNAVAGKINGGQGTLGKLVNDKTLYRQAAAGVSSLHEDADALQHNFLLRGYFNNRGYSNPAELKEHEIQQLPAGQPAKTFSYASKTLFDKLDSSKLKNEKSLNAAGEYLHSQKFGLAVIAVSTGMKGDTDKDRVLSEARSYVIRKYLVDHFGIDDTHLKTIGLGKSTEDAPEGGDIQILIYAAQPNK